MSSDQTDVFINSRSRLRSDDFIREAQLRAKAQISADLAQYQDLDYRGDTATGIGGVVGGFDVDCVSGTLQCRIYPGIGMLPQVPAAPNALYDPPQLWLEIKETQTIDLSSFVDPVNPRLITIELESVPSDQVSEVRDIFDVNTGLFKQEMVAVVKGSRLEAVAPYIAGIIVNAGFPSVAPQVAAGAAGRLPIAVIKLSAATAAFPDQFVSVLMCRPLFSALAVTPTVGGGGFGVGEVVGAAIAATTAAYAHDMSATLNGLPARIRGSVSFAGSIAARTPNTTSPAALIAATGPVYGYLAPPPWANDYDVIAPRECLVRNPNAVDITTPDSVVLGDGGTFISLTIGNSNTDGPLLENCIAIFDDSGSPPDGLRTGLLGFAPGQIFNAFGPHPTTAAGGTITLDDTQDPTWGNSQEVTDTVYIGALTAVAGFPGFAGQAYQGGGRVELIEPIDVGTGTGSRPIFQTTASSAGVQSLFPGRYPAMQVGDLPTLPDAAQSIVVGIAGNYGTAAQALIVVSEVFGFGGEQAAGVGAGYRRTIDAVNSPNYSADDIVEMNRANDGSIIYQTVSGGAPFSFTIHMRGYEDLFLADR